MQKIGNDLVFFVPLFHFPKPCLYILTNVCVPLDVVLKMDFLVSLTNDAFLPLIYQKKIKIFGLSGICKSNSKICHTAQLLSNSMHQSWN